MRIAVTGNRGQVARALLGRAAPQTEIVAVGRPALDLTDAGSVLASLSSCRPDVIVNAAAYTAVDRAEQEPEIATAVNEEGAAAVAQAARQLGVPVVQLSTDYVFDGKSPRPYREEDPAAPLGVYGRSKLAGERAVAVATPRHVILRTSWVYSPFGNNFVRTMLKLASTRPEIGVVADQWGAPTSALDIAEAIVAISRNLTAAPSDGSLCGTFHMTATGEASWADFAETIFAVSAAHDGPTTHVRRIATAEYPTMAQRPANSRLDCTKLAGAHQVVLPFWKHSVAACVVPMLAAAATHTEDSA